MSTIDLLTLKNLISALKTNETAEEINGELAKYENKHSFKNELKVNVKPRVVTSDEFCDKIDELEKQYDREIDD